MIEIEVLTNGVILLCHSIMVIDKYQKHTYMHACMHTMFKNLKKTVDKSMNNKLIKHFFLSRFNFLIIK